MRRMIPQKKRLLNADVFNLVSCCCLTNFVIFIEKITFLNNLTCFNGNRDGLVAMWQFFHLCWKILKVHNLIPCCCLTIFVLFMEKITFINQINLF